MHKKGVTLIEIVIALFVFAVGILAVVRVITTNISVIDTMKLKIQAQSLAKEGIDLVFNIRDTNLARGLDWQCAYINPEAISKLEERQPFNGQICGGSFWPDSAFRVAVDPEGRLFAAETNSGATFEQLFTDNQLFITNLQTTAYSWQLLTHDTTQGTGSLFARYITFEPVYQEETAVDTDKLLKVTSHVLYQKGAIQGEVTLESFIWAIKK